LISFLKLIKNSPITDVELQNKIYCKQYHKKVLNRYIDLNPITSPKAHALKVNNPHYCHREQLLSLHQLATRVFLILEKFLLMLETPI
jgi:hypothetical protein